MKKVKTTVIGSYPVQINNMELMKKYFNQTEISWEKYIKKAVEDMVNAGIDLISDGQTRDPFVNIFFRKLKGCRIRDRAEVIDKIEHVEPITVEDQKYVKTLLPPGKELIGLLTGPYTLTKTCVDLFYNDEKQLAFDFADALRKEAKILQKHVHMIGIDEPFFSISIPEYARELIVKIIKGLSCPTRLHVCGDVSNIVPKLLEIPVDVLSHEFKASPHLFNVFKDYSFKQHICLGSVRSDDTRVETAEEIKTHIEKGIETFNGRISQISPDCGLRLLPRNVAFQKLKNLVKAKEAITIW
ncbi:MAG: methionine synthase [Thermoplasmata archaeon]|nr:MAG: methionine synthase [Thermoplasmata archaeon]RLF53609.1 MAG: methionine synthase [Thermoplasmata archaeon]